MPPKRKKNQVDEKLIRDRTGHRSNALLTYEKSRLQQQSIVSKLLGPPTLVESATTTTETTNNSSSNETEIPGTSTKSSSFDESEFPSFDFEIADELLSNMPLALADTTTMLQVT